MSSINHKYSSSVERYKLANQKVRGSILTQVVLSFCCPLQIYTSFYPEFTRKTRVQNTRGAREIELTESRV